MIDYLLDLLTEAILELYRLAWNVLVYAWAFSWAFCVVVFEIAMLFKDRYEIIVIEAIYDTLVYLFYRWLLIRSRLVGRLIFAPKALAHVKVAILMEQLGLEPKNTDLTYYRDRD